MARLQGQGGLKITGNGLVWRRAGGGKPVEVKKAGLCNLRWHY
jgi:hypothetical protein